MVHSGEQKRFRTDIEGLRAFAILPILVFHLDPRWMPGGFVGVDIFFVISGYLISQQILRASPGGFSFTQFYWRRVCRLFPALAVTVALCLAAGWRFLTPADFTALAWSALASLGGFANFHFLLSVDYFNDAALLHPLLHVWSLSVEEQFYLVWPAFLVLLLSATRRALLAGIVVAGFVSLAASIIASREAPHIAFYMMPFRIFEFAIGALVALAPLRLSRLHCAIAGAAGFALLALSTIVFHAQTPWPGANALIPSLGTALLIAGGQDGLWSRFLSFPVFRLIGRISYSVYLVHWPLIVFYRYWAVVPPTAAELGLLFGASLALGALLYLFVERVYRISPEPKISWVFVGSAWARSQGAKLEAVFVRRRRQVFLLFLMVPVAAAGSAAAIISNNGYPERLKKGRVQQQAGDLTFAGDLCNNTRSRCAFGDPAAARVVYLVGDSHALNLVYGLDMIFKSENIRGVALYDHGCLFLKNTKRFIRGVADKSCARNVADAFAQLERDRHPVIFVGNYGGYINQIGRADADAPFAGSGNDYLGWIAERFRQSLKSINADKRGVVILTQAYDTGVDTAKCALQHGPGDPRCVPQSLAQVRKTDQAVDAMIHALKRDFPMLTIADSKSAFCTAEACATDGHGRPYFRDTTHLTNEGSVHLMQTVWPAIRPAIVQGGG